MNGLEIFNYQNNNVRVVNQNGDLWFVAKDVCEVLNLEQVSRAMDRLDDDERGLLKVTHPQNPEKELHVNGVNESGLYQLIIASNKPEAKQFKRWITHEVLPSIRKHGMYATERTVEAMLNDPDTMIKTLQALKLEREQRKALEHENIIQKQIIGELKPKADYTDAILQNKGLVTITQIAKDYGMSGQAMNYLLHDLGVQYKQSGQWLLYHQHHGKGYTHSNTIDIQRSDGRPDVKMNTKWTQRGRLFLYELLKQQGTLPKIEQSITS